LACASASALSGLESDLLLTSTTCNGWVKLFVLRGSGMTRAMPNSAKPWNANEKIIENEMADSSH
jgi:hypothetical protein